MSKANEISELKDLTKYRLDEINKIKLKRFLKLKREKILLNFLLHYQHRLAL